MKKLDTVMVFLILILFLSGCVTSSKQASEKTGAIPYSVTEETKKWELVSDPGTVKMVYMSSAGLKDKDYIAKVLTHLVDKKYTSVVHFFDNKKYTPLHYPMTNKQLLHWKAHYIFNPHNGYEWFAFVEVINSQTSPPDLKEIEAEIGPFGHSAMNSTKGLATNSEYLIKELQETGFIGKINIESNKVWVEESLWYSMNIGNKENIINLISQYFNEKRGYERVTVYGWRTGKVLATKTLFGGIKFY